MKFRISEEYREGYNARIDGHSEDENPHTTHPKNPKGPKGKEWYKGWLDAEALAIAKPDEEHPYFGRYEDYHDFTEAIEEEEEDFEPWEPLQVVLGQ